MTGRPSCIVLRPLGRDTAPGGGVVDFDDVYLRVIRPAIEAAGCEPVGLEDLPLGKDWAAALTSVITDADVAVVDVTCPNTFVDYALGLRQGARPGTALVVSSDESPLDRHVLLRPSIHRYPRTADLHTDEAATSARVALTRALRELLAGPAAKAPLAAPGLPHDRAEGFDRVRADLKLKEELAAAREARDAGQLRGIEAALQSRPEVERGVWADLFLSWRALGQTAEMVRLYDELPPDVRADVMVREQLAFALNREKRREEAQRVLEEVVAEVGENPETLGLLGRIHKDRWQDALTAGDAASATAHLDQAIAAYRAGFESDWRDAYPGVNLVTLLELRASPQALREQAEVLPVVRYAAKQRLRKKPGDYWDHATLLELAALAEDGEAARKHAADALATRPEPWQLETTRAQLEKLRKGRAERGAAVHDITELLGLLAGEVGRG